MKRAHRLSPHVRPGDVDVHLAVDASRSDRFRGEVALSVSLDRPTRVLELHACDIRVSRPLVEVGGRRMRGTIRLRPERETLEILLPERVPAGAARIALHFSGRLRNDLRGLYKATSGKRTYAISQLAATHARRLFPCFDEPAMKARFALSVTTGRQNQVISNQPEERVVANGDGTKTVHFQRTPPLSSYLLALAVGAFVVSHTRRCGQTPIRVWSVPEKRGMASFALATAKEVLSRLERYFDIPHPYPKLDLVAVPDFEFGAMENAGAVFFREALLLVDPRSASHGEQVRAAEVICHELAHMWFGNLVTMAWWDDLWLNESFATWMAFTILDGWRPEWQVWRLFQHGRAAALEVDALEDTHPVYVAVKSPAEATENFDLITYQKGASVVRMIERFLGERSFRTGVRRYLRAHREGNTVGADFWNALADAAQQDVEPIVRAWIEQPGHPLLELRRGAKGGVLSLRQRDVRGAGGRWPVPFVGLLGGGGRPRRRLERHLLARVREDVAVGDFGFVYGNGEEAGFWRPAHAPAVFAELLGHLGTLSSLERMGLVGHQWALVRSGYAPLGSFLSLASRLGAESDPEVLATLERPLHFVTARVAGSCDAEVREAWTRHATRCFGPQADHVHFRPKRDRSDDARMRGAAGLRILGGILKLQPLCEAAEAQCERYLGRRSAIDPNLADAVVEIAAHRGDAALYEQFRSAWLGAHTPQEGRRFLLALASFREPPLIDATLALCRGDQVAGGDTAQLLVRALENPAASERAWAFYERHAAVLTRRMGAMLSTRVAAATPALGPAARRRVARHFRAHPLPSGARVVRQALERFDRDAAFLATAGDDLRRWLSSEAAP